MPSMTTESRKRVRVGSSYADVVHVLHAEKDGAPRPKAARRGPEKRATIRGGFDPDALLVPAADAEQLTLRFTPPPDSAADEAMWNAWSVASAPRILIGRTAHAVHVAAGGAATLQGPHAAAVGRFAGCDAGPGAEFPSFYMLLMSVHSFSRNRGLGEPVVTMTSPLGMRPRPAALIAWLTPVLEAVLAPGAGPDTVCSTCLLHQQPDTAADTYDALVERAVGEYGEFLALGFQLNTCARVPAGADARELLGAELSRTAGREGCHMHLHTRTLCTLLLLSMVAEAGPVAGLLGIEKGATAAAACVPAYLAELLLAMSHRAQHDWIDSAATDGAFHTRVPLPGVPAGAPDDAVAEAFETVTHPQPPVKPASDWRAVLPALPPDPRVPARALRRVVRHLHAHSAGFRAIVRCAMSASPLLLETVHRAESGRACALDFVFTAEVCSTQGRLARTAVDASRQRALNTRLANTLYFSHGVTSRFATLDGMSIGASTRTKALAVWNRRTKRGDAAVSRWLAHHTTFERTAASARPGTPAFVYCVGAGVLATNIFPTMRKHPESCFVYTETGARRLPAGTEFGPEDGSQFPPRPSL